MQAIGVDAGPPQRRDDEVAGEVLPDRPEGADARPEAREVDRGAARGTGGGGADLIQQPARLTAWQVDDGPPEHIHDVGPRRDDGRVGGPQRVDV